jgi:hypothetical protein
MKPTLGNLFISGILLYALRFIVLQYYPTIIINGYFSIFLCFFVVSILFTNNYLFSASVGLFVTNGRILYRSIKDKKTLNDYNSVSNCVIFAVGIILLSILLVNYKRIDAGYSNYYGPFIATLIFINLYSLKINEQNTDLVCFV